VRIGVGVSVSFGKAVMVSSFVGTTLTVARGREVALGFREPWGCDVVE